MEARSSGSISLGSIHKTCGPGRPQLHLKLTTELRDAHGIGFEGMKNITLRGLWRTVPCMVGLESLKKSQERPLVKVIP